MPNLRNNTCMWNWCLDKIGDLPDLDFVRFCTSVT